MSCPSMIAGEVLGIYEKGIIQPFCEFHSVNGVGRLFSTIAAPVLGK
jgi:hypothetical protein